mmetsp:Transcript_17391/g.47448  ORF Transcript_17391/g.47448 Transcript_17391/m.47448 type:complete len:1513 (-) Transcript_17391:117-4655(-)
MVRRLRTERCLGADGGHTDASGSAADESWPLRFTCAVATAIFFVAFSLSGHVLPRLMTSQCTTQQGMCTPGACECTFPRIKRELVTQESLLCFQCVDEFCPAVAEGDAACSLAMCECEDPTWPRMDVSNTTEPCWQCVHPPQDMTIRQGGSNSGCFVDVESTDSGGQLRPITDMSRCTTFRYDGASIRKKDGQGRCLAWFSFGEYWGMADCEATQAQSRRFRLHAAMDEVPSELLCSGTNSREFCVQPAEYMCTDDISQCSMGSCRCENASWVKQELQTLNGSTCFACVPPVVQCSTSPEPDQCTEVLCECADPTHVKVEHEGASEEKSPCFSCQKPPSTRRASWWSFLSTVVTFVFCVLVGLALGCWIRRLVAPAASPREPRGSKRRQETWSERWPNRLERVRKAMLVGLSALPDSTSTPFPCAGNAFSYALEKSDNALEAWCCAMDVLQDWVRDGIAAVWACFARCTSSCASERTQELELREETGKMLPRSPFQKVAACLLESGAEGFAPESVKDLCWDPLQLSAAVAAEASSGPPVQIPPEWMKLMCSNGANRAQRMSALNGGVTSATQSRALRRLQQRREAASVRAAAAIATGASMHQENPIDESWIDDVDQDACKGKKGKEGKQLKKERRTTTRNRKKHVCGAHDLKTSGVGSAGPDMDSTNFQASEADDDEEAGVESFAASTVHGADMREGTASSEVTKVGFQEAPPDANSSPIPPMERPIETFVDGDVVSLEQGGTKACGPNSQGVELLLERLQAGISAREAEPGAAMSDVIFGEAIHGLFMLAAGGSNEAAGRSASATASPRDAGAELMVQQDQKSINGEMAGNNSEAHPSGHVEDETKTSTPPSVQVEEVASEYSEQPQRRRRPRGGRKPSKAKPAAADVTAAAQTENVPGMAASDRSKRTPDQSDVPMHRQLHPQPEQLTERRRKSGPSQQDQQDELPGQPTRQQPNLEDETSQQQQQQLLSQTQQQGQQQKQQRQLIQKQCEQGTAPEQQSQHVRDPQAKQSPLQPRRQGQEKADPRKQTHRGATEQQGQHQEISSGAEVQPQAEVPAVVSKPLDVAAPDFIPLSMMLHQPPPEDVGVEQRRRHAADLPTFVPIGPEDMGETDPTVMMGDDSGMHSLPITTVMISGISMDHTSESFRHQLDGLGLLGTYNFFFMPTDGHGHQMHAGYAVVNFIDPTFAELCQWMFAQFQFEGTATPSHVQGLESNIAYWNQFADNLNTPLVIPMPTPSEWAVNGVNTMLNSKFSPQIKEQFHKTKMCVFYKKNRCALAAACPFAHRKEELQPAPDLAKTKLCYNYFRRRCNDRKCRFAHGYQELRATTNVYKTELCRWWNSGSCKAGGSCRYAHGVEELRGAMPIGFPGAFPLPEFTDMGSVGSIGDATDNFEIGSVSDQNGPQEADNVGDEASDMGLSDTSAITGAHGNEILRQHTVPAAYTYGSLAGLPPVPDKDAADSVVIRLKSTFMEAVQIPADIPMVPIHRSWSEGDLPQLGEVMEGLDGFDSDS